MTSFAVSYAITTPESAQYGDYEEEGMLDCGLSLRDAVAMVLTSRTPQCDGISAIDTDEYPMRSPHSVRVMHGMEFQTGAYESRTLHFPSTLTAATRRRIARLVGA